MNTYPETRRLFVYGIFLDQSARDSYFMFNPRYATVKGYVTKGNHIVSAYPSSDPMDCLTGLLVDILDDPMNWRMLDLLESGYQRILIKTTSGETAYMYAKGTRKELDNATIQREKSSLPRGN